MFCCALLYVHSSFAINLMGKRELVAFLSLSSCYPVIVELLFPAVPWVCLQVVIMVFPAHTHLLFVQTVTNYHYQNTSKITVYIFFRDESYQHEKQNCFYKKIHVTMQFLAEVNIFIVKA